MACHWKLQNIEDYDTKPFVKQIIKMLRGDGIQILDGKTHGHIV
jgi:hypothetical protein